MKRYDKHGNELHVGEFVRGDGRYVFKQTSGGKQHVVYAHSLDELRYKEREFLSLNPSNVYKPEPSYKTFRISDIMPVVSQFICDQADAKAFCYLISDGTYIKIGKAKDVQSRLIGLQNANGNPLKVVCTIPCKSETDARILEKRLHRFFSAYRTSGEWFDIMYRIDTLAIHDTFGAVLNTTHAG